MELIENTVNQRPGTTVSVLFKNLTHARQLSNPLKARKDESVIKKYVDVN